MPGVAQHVVDAHLAAIALGAVTVRRVVVRVPAKDHHQSRRNERGRMEELGRGGGSQQSPGLAPWFVTVQSVAQRLAALALRDDSSVNVDLLRQRIVAGAVSVASFDGESPRVHDSPLAGHKVVLLHRVEVAELWRVPEDHHHHLQVALLPVVIISRNKSRRVPGAPDRLAPSIAGRAVVRLHRDVLPDLGVHVERPQFAAHAPLADNAAVHEDLVAEHDRGRAVANVRVVRPLHVHRLPHVPVEVVRAEQLPVAVALAADYVERVPPNCGAVRGTSRRRVAQRLDRLPVAVRLQLAAVVARVSRTARTAADQVVADALLEFRGTRIGTLFQVTRLAGVVQQAQALSVDALAVARAGTSWK